MASFVDLRPMQIDFHTSFKKEFRKLSPKNQHYFDQRFLLFCQNKNNPLLNYHELSGELAEIYSINVTGDIRAQFYGFVAQFIPKT